jgi:hypothetical protein
VSSQLHSPSSSLPASCSTPTHHLALFFHRWYDAWRGYTAQASAQNGPDSSSSSVSAMDPPGPIDNSNLLSAGPQLKEHLTEGKDYVLLTSSSWGVLRDWYGSYTEIGRTAVMEGVAPNSKRPRVVVYPLHLDVWNSDKEVKPMQADQSVSGQPPRPPVAVAAHGHGASRHALWCTHLTSALAVGRVSSSNACSASALCDVACWQAYCLMCTIMYRHPIPGSSTCACLLRDVSRHVCLPRHVTQYGEHT